MTTKEEAAAKESLAAEMMSECPPSSDLEEKFSSLNSTCNETRVESASINVAVAAI